MGGLFSQPAPKIAPTTMSFPTTMSLPTIASEPSASATGSEPSAPATTAPATTAPAPTAPVVSTETINIPAINGKNGEWDKIVSKFTVPFSNITAMSITIEGGNDHGWGNPAGLLLEDANKKKIHDWDAPRGGGTQTTVIPIPQGGIPGGSFILAAILYGGMSLETSKITATVTGTKASTFANISRFGAGGGNGMLILLFLLVLIAVLYYLHTIGKLKIPSFEQRMAAFGKTIKSLSKRR